MNLPKTVDIPSEVSRVTRKLEENGFEAYLVGGCVRDLLLQIIPKDWDITTSATPEEVQRIFDHSHYDNTYGTVRVVNDEYSDPSLEVVEVTTYRKEFGYSDNRRPDVIEFSRNVEDDLSRRDFTINAFALKVTRETETDVTRETLLDLFGGLEDLEKKLIRTVGSPDERFGEDALRLIRAVRFAAQLDFTISAETLESIEKNSSQLSTIAVERVQAEFSKLILSPNPSTGLEVSRRTGLLEHILPELLESVGIEQNQAHSFTVWEHLLRSLQAAADKEWPLELRLAALFHDIAKPHTRAWSEEKQDWTFYGHEVVGSRITRKALERLKYPKEVVSQVTKLVRWHMFFSDPEEVTLSAVRRLISNVGKEDIWNLTKLRVADRIGTGRPKEEPFRLRKYKSMIEEALRDPLSVKMLKIDGNMLMKELELTPGPLIGNILQALMEEVLDDPTLNTQKYLRGRAKELSELPQEELERLAKSGKDKLHKAEEEELKAIRDKYHVS